MLTFTFPRQENIDLMSQRKKELLGEEMNFMMILSFFFLITKKTLSNLHLAGKLRSYHLLANNNSWGASFFFMKTA